MKRISRIVLAALFGAVLPFSAQAQQAVLQGGTWVTGHVPVYAPSSGYAQPVIIDSGSAPAVISLGTAGQMGWYASTGTTISGNSNANISSGALTLGQTGTAAGSLKLSGLVSGLVTIQPQSVAGTFNFNLPASAGTSGTPLLSGGGSSSPMTWGALSGTTSTFATTTGSFTTGHCLTTDGSGNITDSGTGCGGSGTVNPGSTGQFAYYASSTNAVSGSSVLSVSGSTVSTTGALTSGGAFTVSTGGAAITGNTSVSSGSFTASGGAFTASPSSANVTISPTGTGVVTINPGTLGSLDNMTVGGTTKAAGSFTTLQANTTITAGVAASSSGTFNLAGGTSGTVSIKPQAAAGTYNFNLPITAGTSGTPLLSGGGGSSAMTYGSISGNTSSFATTTGSLTSGHLATWDASGNLQDGGAPPTGSINSGTAGQMTYYAGSGTTVSGNANVTYSAGALTVGVAGSQAGSLLVTGSSTGTITLKGSGSTIGTYNFNLPTTAGSANQPLLSGGGASSAMAWGSLSGNTTKFGTVTGSLTNGNCVAADASGNLIDNGTPCGSGGSGTVTSSTAGQIAYYASSTNAVAGNSSLTISGGVLTTGVTSTTTGKHILAGGTSGAVTIAPQAAAGTYEFDLPTTAGSAGQVLTSQGGAGTAMTWTTPSSWPPAATAVSTGTTASANTLYCANTSSAAFTLTLPASPSAGDKVGWMDCNHTFGTNNLTIGRNGNKIMDLSENMVVSGTNQGGTLIWYAANSTWLFVQ